MTLGSGRAFSSYGPGLDVYPPTRFHQVGVALPHEVVTRRVEARYHQQMADGFLAETRALLAAPEGMSRTARQALGYAELIDHLTAGVPLDEALVVSGQPRGDLIAIDDALEALAKLDARKARVV